MKPLQKLTFALLAFMIFAVAPAATSTLKAATKADCEMTDMGPKDFEIKSAVVVQENDGRLCVHASDGCVYEPVNLKGMMQSGRLTTGSTVSVKVITVDGGNVGAGSVTVIII